MQKLLLSISLALLCCFSAMGATVTFVPGTDVSSNTSIEKDGITLTATTFDNASYYQTYSGQNLKVESTVGNITKIEITCTASGTSKYGPGCYSLSSNSTGSYTYSGEVGTWTGNTSSAISFGTSAQVRMTQVVVTYSSSANAITIEDSWTLGGSITSDKTSAAAGETVTITSTPDAGNVLSNVYVCQTSNTNVYEEATVSGNTATFTMPAYPVTVYAAFSQEVETVLVSVEISGTPAKMQYAIGETFSTEGLTVTAHYLDDNNNEIDQDVTDQAAWTINPATAFTAAGTQTVTVMAAFGGEDDMEEYSVTVVKKKPTLTPSALTMNMEVGDRESLECTTEPANLALTYTIADTTIAKTHEDVPSTIIAVAPGTTTCTIAFAGNDTYQASSISVTINVADTTGSGTDPEESVETDCGDALAGTYSITPNNALWGTDYSGTTTTATQLNGGQNGICMEVKKGGSNDMYVNESQTRAYSGYTMQFDVPEGFLITAILFTADGSNWKGTHSASVGTMTDNKNWTGSSKTVTITFGGTCRIAGIQVTYIKDNATDVANTQETAYTVAEALEIIDNRSTNNSAIQAVFVGGTIKSVTEISASYGNATYVIEDGAGNELTIYHGKWLGNAAFTAADSTALAAGDEVIVYGILILYQKDGQDDVYEMKSGNYVVYHNRPAATLLGDVNKDGAVDVSDISTLAEYIFGNTPAQFDADAADANKDGAIDVSDISTIAEIIFAN